MSGVQTRSQARGAPLKKEGAYNTDLYYQEKDEGFGDVGVDQEPDAGALDDPSDPEFKATKEDLQAADTRAAEEAAEIPDTNQEDKQDVKDMMEEAKFVTEGAKGGEPELDAQGEPVPVDETTADDQEAADAGESMAS